MKICVNCKHYKMTSEHHGLGPYSYQQSSCTRLSKINMVTGIPNRPYLSCYTEREDALRLEKERCGYEGKYFVGKYVQWETASRAEI